MSKLHYSIHTSSQYESVFIDDKPVLTIRRKHSYDNRSDAYWKVFRTDGKLVTSLFLNNSAYLHQRITRYLRSEGHEFDVTTWEEHQRA